MKKFLALFLSVVLMLSVIPVGYAAETEYSIVDGTYVRLLGRGEVQKDANNQDTRTFNWPNAGFEFSFSGKTASVYVTDAKRDYSAHWTSYFNVAVYDGDTLVRVNRLRLTTGWNTIYTEQTGDPATKIIRVVRSNEPCTGSLRMSKLKTDATPSPTEARGKLIEFIGDSLTAGYGNSPHLTNATVYCAENTDNWMAYPGIVSRAYHADYNVLAYQGHGLVANIDKSEEYGLKGTMPEQFEYKEIFNNWYPEYDYSTKEKHDFSDYQPDLVCIWLGTNDWPAGVTRAEFGEVYNKFLRTITENYPNAKVLNMSLSNNFYKPEIQAAVETFGGDEQGIYYLELNEFTTTSLGHPDIPEGYRIANQIFAKLNTIPDFWEEKEALEIPEVETPGGNTPGSGTTPNPSAPSGETKGILLADSFEDYSQIADARVSGGGPYSSAGGVWPKTVSGDKRWTNQGNDAQGSMWYKNNRPGASTIHSGKLLIEADISVQGGYTGNAVVDNKYSAAYISVWTTENKLLGVVGNLGNGSGVFVAEGAYYVTSDYNQDVAVTFPADAEQRLSILLDYDDNLIYWYLNGELIRSASGALGMPLNANTGEVGVCGAPAGSAHPTVNGVDPDVYFDDFRIEHINTIEARNASAKEKTVNIQFSNRMVATEAFALSDVIITDEEGSVVANAVDYSFNSDGDVLTLTLDQALSGGTYYIKLGEGSFSSSIVSNALYADPEDGLCFGAEYAPEVLLDLDFEEEAFPANETGQEDISWADCHVSYAVDGTDSYADMSSWTFYRDGREYNYISKATVGTDDMAKLSMSVPFARSQSSQSIFFPLSRTVDNGKLTIEFDMEMIANHNVYVGFGLHDRDDNVTAYNPWATWGDATYFGGLTYESGALVKDVTVNASDKLNMLPDYYMYYNTASSSGYHPGTGSTGKYHDAVLDKAFRISNDTLTLGTDVETWKYEIDFQQQTYSFYRNNTLVKTLNYIPGGEVGNYDAFVVTLLGANKDPVTGTSAFSGIYLDDIKVTHNAVSKTTTKSPVFIVDGQETLDMVSVEEDSEIVVEADYDGTAGRAKMIVAAYRSGILTKVEEVSSDVAGTIVLHTNGEGYYGASEIKVFLFADSTTGFKPLAENIIIKTGA